MLFITQVAKIVGELTDDKLKAKDERKRLQVQNASHKSKEAMIVGMADKIYNLRDLEISLPVGWDDQRRKEYFIWAKDVVQQYYSANDKLANILEIIFSRNIKD